MLVEGGREEAMVRFDYQFDAAGAGIVALIVVVLVVAYRIRITPRKWNRIGEFVVTWALPLFAAGAIAVTMIARWLRD